MVRCGVHVEVVCQVSVAELQVRLEQITLFILRVGVEWVKGQCGQSLQVIVEEYTLVTILYPIWQRHTEGHRRLPRVRLKEVHVSRSEFKLRVPGIKATQYV